MATSSSSHTGAQVCTVMPPGARIDRRAAVPTTARTAAGAPRQEARARTTSRSVDTTSSFRSTPAQRPGSP